MTEIGRNDPCPCGSGKKYKKCCLEARRDQDSRRRDEDSAVRTALGWLSQHHADAVDEAIQGDYFGELDDAEEEALNDLPPGLRGMLDINVAEWLLADALLSVGTEMKRARDLLFTPGGPLLPARGREWLMAVTERPMGLYEIQEAKPGKALRVKDLLRPEEPDVWVEEKTASQRLVRWDVLGARLARRDAGWVFTGALYPLAREEAAACRGEILEDMEGEEWDSPLARDLIGAAISTHWLQGLVAHRALPEIVDASTGEPLTLVTEHYRVRDWALLEAALAAQPDVEGSRTNDWVQFTEVGGEERRSRAALNVREPDLLEVFCRTLPLADEARAWIQEIAGEALEHRAREVVDPKSAKARESAARAPATRPPPEVETRLVHDFLRKHYDNWTEEPIPALGQETPREALRTPEGKRAVIDLLKSYEQHEAHKAREDGTEPFDFAFLWERLGLERDTGG